MNTLWGPIADSIGAITQTQAFRGPYGLWERSTHFAAPSTMYRRTQAPVAVHIDHEGPELGNVEHLELMRDKQLIAVATLDLDRDLTDGDWYWSPTIRSGHRTGVLDLLELSLTRRPASISLRAVRALPGNLRYLRDRQSWDLPASVMRMMEAAADRAPDEPILISPTPATPSFARAASAPPIADTLPPSRLRNANRTDGLFISRGGRILDVR